VRKLGIDPDQILYEYFESDAKWIAALTGKDTYEFKDGGGAQEDINAREKDLRTGSQRT
jgi:hypothetical protein